MQHEEPEFKVIQSPFLCGIDIKIQALKCLGSSIDKLISKLETLEPLCMEYLLLEEFPVPENINLDLLSIHFRRLNAEVHELNNLHPLLERLCSFHNLDPIIRAIGRTIENIQATKKEQLRIVESLNEVLFLELTNQSSLNQLLELDDHTFFMQFEFEPILLDCERYFVEIEYIEICLQDSCRMMQLAKYPKFDFESFETAAMIHQNHISFDQKDHMDVVHEIEPFSRIEMRTAYFRFEDLTYNVTHEAIEEILVDYKRTQLLLNLPKTTKVEIENEIYVSTKGVPQETKLRPALYNLATSQNLERMTTAMGENKIKAYMSSPQSLELEMDKGKEASRVNEVSEDDNSCGNGPREEYEKIVKVEKTDSDNLGQFGKLEVEKESLYKT